MLFFIGTAFADAAAQATTKPSALTAALPMVFIFGLMYFMMIRPQQKRAKQHKALLDGIKKGDKVITNSGIIGTVTKIVNENEVVIEIADKVFVKFVKSAISTVFERDRTEQAESAEITKEG